MPYCQIDNMALFDIDLFYKEFLYYTNDKQC